MFQLGKTIVSEAILEEDFTCNLSACKGACCIDGDAGAPLEAEEAEILKVIYPKVKPLLREEAVRAITAQGVCVTSNDGTLETPLIGSADCAYVIFDKENTALCAIEEAYNRGDITWRKPISCHLYPVRVSRYRSFSAINYHKWSICSHACVLGKTLRVPVYKFVKEALIRKFGDAWYRALEAIAERHRKTL